MTQLVKVTMNLTKADVKNAEMIEKLTHARSRAHAVSTALSAISYIVKELARNPETQILIRSPDGKVERLVIPGLQTMQSSESSDMPDT